MKAVFVLSLCLFVALGSTTTWNLSPEQDFDQSVPFSFKMAMKPQNLDEMDALFWQISDPESPLFGKFLSNEQIADMISLPDEQIAKVENYLQKGAGKFCDVKVERSVHRDYLLVDTCASQAAVIFPNLRLAVYEQAGSHRRVLRSAALIDLAENLHFLGVPEELHEYLAGVYDVTDVPVPKERKTEKPTASEFWLPSDKALTITEIMDRFNITQDGITSEALAADSPQVRQAVVELDNGAFSQHDLYLFQKRYGVKIDPVVKVVGVEDTEEINGEADLDVQTITAVAQGAQTWSFVFATEFTWIDVVETIMKNPASPKVISCCWSTVESYMGKSSTLASNIQFMKLGLAGFTWLQDAGDAGPVLNPYTCDVFDSKFPSGSQYVVTVGGVKIDKYTMQEGSWFRSGGGFSAYLPRAPVQNDVVDEYLKKTTLPPNPNGQRYSTTGRAFPDIAGFSAYYPIIYDGKFSPQGGNGTSAATPQVAGIVTLIQIQRYQLGLPPLGPLIQPLYKLKDGVGFDVTLGQTYAVSRNGCTGDILPGFFAEEGWDAATGLGSPKYDVLREQLLHLGEKKP